MAEVVSEFFTVVWVDMVPPDTLAELVPYVFGQAGASIYTYIKCLGWAKFWNQLREMKHHEERLNIRQRELIDEWTGKNPKRIALEYDEKEPEMRSSF